MNYSFLTTENWRIDATARTPKKAFEIAKKKLVLAGGEMFGQLTETYFKYNKDGFHAVDGKYYQLNNKGNR